MEIQRIRPVDNVDKSRYFKHNCTVTRQIRADGHEIARGVRYLSVVVLRSGASHIFDGAIFLPSAAGGRDSLGIRSH